MEIKNLVDEDFVNYVYKVSGGNPAIVEQMVMLSKDLKRNNLKFVNYHILLYKCLKYSCYHCLDLRHIAETIASLLRLK